MGRREHYEEKTNDVIRQGQAELPFGCGGCRETGVPFSYTLRHILFVYHGSREGFEMEGFTLDITLPEYIQCRECRTVYKTKVPGGTWGEYRYTGLGEPVVTSSFGSRGDIDRGLKKALESISLEPLGTPEEV